MKTPIERLIEAVEKGYNNNPALWEEWKLTMLDAEQELIKKAFLCGDNSEFHYNISNITSVKDFLDYYRNCH